MEIKPRNKTLFLCKEVEEEKKNDLYIPATARNSYYRVAFAGPEADITVGTIVVPNARESGKITVGGIEYVVTDSDKVFATLE